MQVLKTALGRKESMVGVGFLQVRVISHVCEAQLAELEG
jgi:hypothetical protein